MRTRLPSLWLIAMTALAAPCGFAQEGTEAATDEKLLGIMAVHGNSICLDNLTRGELDHLAPQLTALPPGTIVKIEGYSPNGANREEQVRNSLYLALQAQRYLRSKYALNPELLYLAVAPANGQAKSNSIRIVTYPDSFRALHVSAERGGK